MSADSEGVRMRERWRPSIGQPVSIQTAGGAQARGTVCKVDPWLEVDLGRAVPASPGSQDVVVDAAGGEGLYRVWGEARPVFGSLGHIELEVHEVEHLQRRQTPRLKTPLPVAITAYDEPGLVAGLQGKTVDLSPGGCRVVLSRPLPPAAHHTLSIQLPEDGPVVALAHVLEARVRPGHCEYRMAFDSLTEEVGERLVSATSSPTADSAS